jgi:hypothetical protein
VGDDEVPDPDARLARALAEKMDMAAQRMLLLEVIELLSPVDGLPQRLESHEECCRLDARDRLALQKAAVLRERIRACIC